MKNPFEHRKGYGLPEYLAYLSIKAAIRPLLRAKRYVAVIVRPPDAEPMPYLRAAVSVIDTGTRFRSSTAVGVFNPAKLKGSVIEIEEALQEDKVVLLFPDEASITSAARLAADVVVKLEPPATVQVQRVFRWRYGARLTDAQAALFVGLDAESQRAIARPGKSVGRMLSQLAMRPREMDAPPVPPPSRSANDEVEIDLESMSGYGAARDWGLQLKEDLKDWDANAIPWSDVDKGLLLSGPPGVGKTLYAQALATTCGVELIVASAARWQSKGHLGDMQRAMFKSFEEARKSAPAILFIDEVDSFGDRDADQGPNSNYSRQVVNAFLECLDGTVDREGVVVVGACNNPTVIDPAILRPGRLDYHIRLALPDAEARKGILHMHLRGDLSADDFSTFADESVGMTGADIARIVRLARRVARKQRRAVTPSDIMASLPGKITISQKLRRNIAIHELGHAVVAIMTGTRKLTSISVEPRATGDLQQQVLGNAIMEADEQSIRNKQTYLDNIAILMGGMAAEQVFLGEHGDGVTSDLDDATRIAMILDRHLGMNGVLNAWPTSFDIRMINDVRRHDSALLRRIEPILQEQLARAKTIIESRRTQISGLWLDLIERGSLSGHEIEEKLWLENKIPMPTPRMRRKIRQRLS